MNAIHLMVQCFPYNGFLWEIIYRETLHIVFIFWVHMLACIKYTSIRGLLNFTFKYLHFTTLLNVNCVKNYLAVSGANLRFALQVGVPLSVRHHVKTIN